jgi:Flp pilus assembly protein TadD
MANLEPPDTHALSAAQGWLELGNAAEALSELAKISPAQQAHPSVLELRWSACAATESWAPALETATDLIRVAPENANGWLNRAYALRRVEGGGLAQAWEALLPAVEIFPKEPVVFFNLACYACQMGRLDEARRKLRRAAEIGDAKDIKRMALEDADLKPLWDELRRDLPD